MIDSSQYVEKKMTLLEECLSLTEELISAISDWESLEDVLSRRQLVIERLQKLEADFEANGDNKKQLISHSNEANIQQLFTLISSLEKDAKRLLQEERDKTIQLMKSNVQGQKVVDYTKHEHPEFHQRGRRFDIKE
jgi:hypothetical protein